LIYDDILGGYIYKSGAPMSASVPIETQIGLANAVGCDLWYNFWPHVTTINSSMEGGSNSISQIAALIKGTLNNNCSFEWGNEIWNPGFGFFATAWAAACARATARTETSICIR